MGLTVQELFAAGLADSTQKAYKSGERSYAEFCTRTDVTPFPTKETFSAFIAHLYREGLAASTVKSYLAAVRHAQIALGLGDPKMAGIPQLEYVTKGLCKKTVGRQKQTHLPITPPILCRMKIVWQRMPCRKDASMLWAASCLCFFAWLSQDGGSSCPLGHRIQPHGAPDLPGRTSRKHIPTKMAKGPDKGIKD